MGHFMPKETRQFFNVWDIYKKIRFDQEASELLKIILGEQKCFFFFALISRLKFLEFAYNLSSKEKNTVKKKSTVAHHANLCGSAIT